MEQLIELGVTIFLSYLVLTTAVKEHRYTEHGESDSRHFTNGHVNKTIQTEDGDVFDCIDINLQPALHHPLLKDHMIQMEPSSYPSGVDLKSPSETTTQAQLPTIACPAGTIPVLQNGKGDLKTPFSFDPTDNTHRAGEVAGCITSDEIYGTQVSINVYEPKVKGKDDYSASWAIVSNGPKGNREAIAAGSTVWPNFRGDNFARFHTYWQSERLEMSCFDHLCPGFVQVNQNIGLGGRIRPVSVYKGKQYDIGVMIFKDPKTKDWWLAYSSKRIPVGYWPNSIFKYMKGQAVDCFWGGQSHGPTVGSEPPQMGSGHWAEEGPGQAAYCRNIKIANKNNELVMPDTHKSITISTREACYHVRKTGYDSNGMRFYFGGPGNCTG